MIYLASPYSDPLREVCIQRYNAAMDFIAFALRTGYRESYGPIYSPIVHYHEVAIRHDLPKDFAFWQSLNFKMIDASRFLFILRLSGWEESVGVQAEYAYAHSQGKQVQFCDPK